MTHTEESLMALVNDALNAAEKAEADHCSPMGSPSFRQSNADAREAEAVLRLALREVLAERNTAIANMQIATVERRLERERAEKAEAERDALAMQLKLKPAPMADCPVYCKTAVDLQAECERLRKDAERYRWARDQIYYKPPGYDGRKVGRWVWDWDLVSENGSDLDAAIDAAMKEQP